MANEDEEATPKGQGAAPSKSKSSKQKDRSIIQVWPNDESYAREDKPYEVAVRKPKWQEIKMAIRMRENDSTLSAGEALYNTLKVEDNPEMEADYGAFIAVCYEMWEFVPFGISSVQKK